jgi:hypothetical protein
VTFDFEGEPGVPVAFVVIEDGSGLEAVPARVTRTGDEVLIEAEVAHFSKAQIVVQTAVIPVEVGCGDTLALGDLCDIVLRDLDQFSGVTSTSFESASAAIAVSASSFDRATFECISEQPLGRAVTVTVIADTSLYSFLQQAGGITGLDASDFIGDYVHRVECVVADSIVPELSVYVVDIGSNRYSVSVPDRAAAGSEVEAEVCGTDTSSSPLTGTGFLSLSPNENAGDPNALHGNSPFGPDGCTMISLHLPDDAITGLWTVFTADEASNTAAEVTQLEVTPGE